MFACGGSAFRCGATAEALEVLDEVEQIAEDMDEDMAPQRKPSMRLRCLRI